MAPSFHFNPQLQRHFSHLEHLFFRLALHLCCLILLSSDLKFDVFDVNVISSTLRFLVSIIMFSSGFVEALQQPVGKTASSVSRIGKALPFNRAVERFFIICSDVDLSLSVNIIRCTLSDILHL